MSAALVDKGITLTEVRDRLARQGHPVSLTALSYWRSGHRLPERQSSLDAIPALEAAIGVDSGTLAKLVVGPSARRLGRVESFDGLLDYPVADPATGAAFTGEGDVSRVSTQVTIVIGEHREIVSTTARRLVVANRDGAEGFTVFMGVDENADVGDLKIRALAGCEIRDDRRLAKNVRSVWLRFPQPLKQGESAMTETVVTQDDGAPLDLDTDYEVAAEQRLEEILIWVRFAPAEVPRRCWVYFSERGMSHEWPVEVDATASVHYRQRDFGPGAIGIRWAW